MNINDNDLRLLEFIENDRKLNSDYYNLLLQNKLLEQKISHQNQIKDLEDRIVALEYKIHKYLEKYQFTSD